jgi:hypothetical protein
MFHRDDPESSREAAERMINTGALARHKALVLGLVMASPGLTAIELWQGATVDQKRELKEPQEVRRRLTDLLATNDVAQGPQRTCRVRNTTMVTWDVPDAEPAVKVGEQIDLWSKP